MSYSEGGQKGDSMCVSVYLELVNLWLLPNTTPLHVIQFIKHHAASAFFNILFLFELTSHSQHNVLFLQMIVPVMSVQSKIRYAMFYY